LHPTPIVNRPFSYRIFRTTISSRYHLVEKIKGAQNVGILVGTLSIGKSDEKMESSAMSICANHYYDFYLILEHYLEVIEWIKRALRKAHKKFYCFVVGKITVTKLANFPEIDVFVLIACPHSSLLDCKVE
jgi:diphthamide synthase subunit DPH2